MINETVYSPAMLMLIGLLGVIIHLVKKAKRLQSRATFNFEWGAFFQKELLSIISSVCVVVAAVVANENITRLKIAGVNAGEFLYIAFFCIGYMGDSMVDWLIGGYEQNLKKRGKI